jgi:hypothetical protein
LRRGLSLAARSAFAASLGLLGLAWLRWGPVYARPPLDVRALPLFLSLILLGAVAARTAMPRSPRPASVTLGTLLALLAALAAATALRGPGGLPAVVEGRGGLLGSLPSGPIDLTPADLERIDRTRRIRVTWAGELRAPSSGTYGLHASGRGRVTVRVDGRTLLTAEGEPLAASALGSLGRGPRQLEVVYEHTGPEPRLRLEWTPPRPDGQPGGRRELLPPRQLGPSVAQGLWFLTDVLAVAVACALGLLVFWVPWEAPRPLPEPAPVTGRSLGLAFLSQLMLVLVMSWPLVTDLVGSAPFGQPDGRLNGWILAWDAHALFRNPAELFQAPVFHPLPDTLAFSEHLLLPSVLTAPFQALGGPALAYNVALLLGYALSGLAVQLLIRRLTRDSLAAFLGGALFATGIHRWINMAHLHVQLTLFLPLLLLALDRFWERRTWARALAVGLCLALQGATSVNLALVSAVVVGVVAALFAAAGLRGRELVRLGLGLAAGALVLVPLIQPYLRMRAFQGEEFTLDYVAGFAATPESYAASAAPLYAAISRRELDPERVRAPLFPGLVTLALGLVGLARAPRRVAVVALAVSGVAILLSLGPATAFYRLLHENLVLVRGMRALTRLSILPVLALCTLAGCAVAGRRRLAVIGLALGLLESWNGPFAFTPYPGPSPVARELEGSTGAVAYLPLGERDTDVMLDGIAHFRPLVNGDSGFMPRGYSRAMELLDGRLQEDGRRLLRAFGVSQVVMRDDPGLPLVARFGGEAIYALLDGPRARAVRPAPLQATTITADGFVVDLGAERSVGRVVFELSEAPWLTAPAVSVSRDGRSWQPVEARADLANAVVSLYEDPRRGRGEVRFAPTRTRFLRLDLALPARLGAFGAGP